MKNRPYGRAQVDEAVRLAELTLAADDAGSHERSLARHILAMGTLLVSFMDEPQPEPEPTPGQTRRRYHCVVCGETYGHNTVAEAFIIHRGDAADHPLTVMEDGGTLVITHNTVREMVHPSQVGERDETGPNDPFSGK